MMGLKKKFDACCDACAAAGKTATDGCTSAPDLDMRDCCDAHDVAYDGQCESRLAADNALFRCIMSKKKISWTGRFLLAGIYWGAVRLFGWRHWQAVCLLVLLTGCGAGQFGTTDITAEPVKIDGEIICCKFVADLGKEYEEVLVARTQNEDKTFNYVIWAKGVKAFEGQRIQKEMMVEVFNAAMKNALAAAGITDPGEIAAILKKIKPPEIEE